MVTEAKNQAVVFKTGAIYRAVPRDGEEVKVEFDAAQQEKVNQLIREAQGRAAKEVRTELETAKAQVTTLQTELTEAKTRAASGTPAERKEGAQDVIALQAQIDEMRTAAATSTRELERLKEVSRNKDNDINNAKGETREVRKQVAMQEAASKIGFVDAMDAIALSRDVVKWSDDRGRFVVIGEGGAERMNGALDPMTLDEFFSEMATKKPHLVRSDMRGGTGSTESKGSPSFGKIPLEKLFGAKSDARLANNLAMSNPAEYKKQRVAAKEAGLI